MCFDLLIHIYELNGVMACGVRRRIQLESKLKRCIKITLKNVLLAKKCLCDENMNKMPKIQFEHLL